MSGRARGSLSGRFRRWWSGKSLRFRLTALLLTVFIAVSASASVVTAVVLRDSYSQNVDSQLVSLANGVNEATQHGNGKAFARNKWLLSESLFVGVFDQSYVPSDTAQDQPQLPLPLPDTAFFTTVYSADGKQGPFRLYGEPAGEGRTVLVAIGMAGMEHSAHVIAIVVTVDGIAAVLAVALLSSYIVRRELRPLHRVAKQADLLAASARTGPPGTPGLVEPPGRLDVPDYPKSTEMGRLVGALDGMLTELREALSERDASEGRLRQFAADASHELRTPLQSIRGYAELRLAGVLTDGDEVDEAMTRIAGEVRRMTGLVESLLALARFDAQQDRGELREPVDLSDLVNGACRDAAAIEPGRPIHRRVAEGVRVAGDADQLARLLANLFGNVRMHTPTGTPVDVALERSAGSGPGGVGGSGSGGAAVGTAVGSAPEAVLTVRDHGPGIPADALPHVFDRFYRVDKGRSRAAGGSGLGLAIVAATVAAHQGTVTIEAPPDGPGALVTVRLPLLAQAGAPTEP